MLVVASSASAPKPGWVPAYAGATGRHVFMGARGRWPSDLLLSVFAASREETFLR